jgi:hypothetical protein
MYQSFCCIKVVEKLLFLLYAERIFAAGLAYNSFCIAPPSNAHTMNNILNSLNTKPSTLNFQPSTSLHSTMSKATCSAFSLAEHIYFYELRLFVFGNDHLAYTLSGLNGLRFLAEVNEDYAYLAAVVCINSTWGIQYGQSAFEGKTAAGADLCLVADGQFYVQTCRKEFTLQGL